MIYKKDLIEKIDEDEESYLSKEKLPGTLQKTLQSIEKLSVKSYQKLPQDLEESVSCISRIDAKIIPFKGYMYSFIAALCYSISNILVRKAPNLNGSDQLVIANLLTIIVMLGICFFKKENPFGKSGDRVLLSLRGIAAVVGLFCLYFGLLLIPPSDC